MKNLKKEKLYTYVSPKAALAWNAGNGWTLSTAWGDAWRMPTVTELYQAITTGPTLTVPNPDLKPEHADTVEVAAEQRSDAGFLRLALFREDVRGALLSQSAPLVSGSTTLYSYVQNVDRTRVQGVELSFDRKTLLADLELSGSVTYADGRPLPNDDLPASVLLPMGRTGPAFLAYPNFAAYTEWNNSLIYSTTAAYLATRIADAAPMRKPAAHVAQLPFNEIKDLQQLLAKQGFDVGKIDGILGQQSRIAVKTVQMKYGLPADSWPTAELLARMRGPRASQSPPRPRCACPARRPGCTRRRATTPMPRPATRSST